MKIRNFLLIFFLIISITFLLFLFSGNKKNALQHISADKLATKHYPSDHYFMQRTWPDAKPSVQALKKGLTQAKYSAQSRSGHDFDQIAWTVQGPGNIGARINTVALHPTDPNIAYVGFSTGGVWKTTNLQQQNNATWTPIFDSQPFSSTGDIALDPNNPQTIYVGTGDVNISGYPFIGDGLYKSTDGGSTWQHLGLEQQSIVSKIIVDPSNSDIIYAATMGLPFFPNTQKGLYKSMDGGNSWSQILFVSDQAGIIDMMINPDNPQVLYAAGWDRVRNNSESIIWGPGAKIYKTTNGGNNWTPLSGGLPTDDQGRIGLAMSGSDPDVIFAMYVDTNSNLQGIYKSVNAGTNWTEIPTDEATTGLSPFALGGFGWYFGKLRVNPANDDHLYLLGVDMWETTNAGGTWDRATPPWWQYTVHADKHDMVFAPTANHQFNFVLATDGGLYAQYDSTWYDMENIPTTQFYRVAWNPHTPADYYGGAQDNGSTGGNSSSINSWPRIFGGDGFQMEFHPNDPNLFLAETQNGGIVATFDGGYFWEGGTDGINNSDRRNWDMPYLLGHTDPNTLYTGTYRVYKGAIIAPYVVWDSISPDLTDGTDNRYHTITTVHESPLDANQVYAGTSDGRVWRTNGNVTNWQNISAGLPVRYVTDIKASPDIADNVYVCHSGYKDNSFIPRLHRSTNRGDDWEDISGDLPDLAINDVYILPGHNDSVIFIANDGGVYGTVDAGTTWDRLGNNMPIVPVYDLEWNPVENTVIAGTFGRSIMTFPLDSVDLMPDSVISSAPPIIEKTPQLTVFPSPASEDVTVRFFNAEPGKGYDLVVLDASGKVIHRIQGKEYGKVEKQFNVNNWPAGMYVVKIKIRHNVIVEQFVVH